MERTGAGAYATTQAEAAEVGEIILLAVPWEAMEEVSSSLGDVTGKTLIDASSASRVGPDGYMESSVVTSSAEIIQSWQPEAHVVKAGIPSAYMIQAPELLGPPPTVMLASDNRSAKESVGSLVVAIGLDA